MLAARALFAPKRALATAAAAAEPAAAAAAEPVAAAEPDEAAEVAAANARWGHTALVRPAGAHGWGVFAARDLAAGELAFAATPLAVLPQRSSHSLQVAAQPERHVHVDLPARFVNHCCFANVGIRDNAAGAFDWLALRDVAAGEELLWDYNCSEMEVAAGFKLLPVEGRPCGGPACEGELRGFAANPRGVVERNGENIAGYLRSG